jgi:acetyl-CoA carboxylase biotin carboxyl carrier protein
MIDLKTLKQLVKLMTDNDLTELDIEGEGDRVKLKRGSAQGNGGVPFVTTPAPGNLAPGSPPSGSLAAGSLAPGPGTFAPGGFAPGAAQGGTATTGSATGAASSAASAEPEGATINSPMVGTFYSAASPDAKPFIAAGDRVTADTVVCIIEAMKVFNEIKAEASGVVERVLVENGQAVEFGQPLFVIKPA